MVKVWKCIGLSLIAMLAVGMALVTIPDSVQADAPTDNVTGPATQTICNNNNTGGVLEVTGEYILIDVDCWHSGHCVVCGVDSDYSCSPDEYCWISPCPFANPVPPGSIITKIDAEVRGVPCSGSDPESAFINVYVNDMLVGGGIETGNCLCDECWPLVVSGEAYASGFPGYVYGGKNDLGLEIEGSSCISDVHVKLYYEKPKAAGLNVSPSISRPFNPALMSVQYLSVSPSQTSAGQPVTITTNVVNTGDQAGNLNVALKINGQVDQSKVVSVGPQATQPVKFTVTRMQPGSYAVDIADQTSGFTIVGETDNAPTVPNSTLIVLAAMGIVATILAVMIILSYRRKAY